MASEKPINIGFIGLSTRGWGAMAHAPALSHPSLHSTINVAALHTSSEASAAAAKQAYSKTWPSINAYSGDNASGIVNDPSVDVVAISVKAPDHNAAVEKVIAAGKNFFIEFPAGRNLEESEEIRRKVNAQGNIQVMVGLQARQSATFRKVKQVIDGGKIGKILSTTVIGSMPRESQRWQPEAAEDSEYTAHKKNGADVLTIAGGHHLDTLHYLLGPFASLSATASVQYPTTSVISSATKEVIRTFPSTSNDHYAFSGPLLSGAHASITWRTGYTSTPGRTGFLWIIDGELGSIKFQSDVSSPVPGSLIGISNPTTTVNGQPLDEYLVSEGIEYSDPQLILEEQEKGFCVESVRRYWLEFAKTLRGGQGEYATLDDAIEVKRVIDAVERSAAAGGLPIKLN